MASLTIEALTKSYRRGAHALRDVTLAAEQGTVLVLVGPSGCGKTTLLRCVAGLEQPDSGTIRLDGRIINDRPPRDRDVAMVFQNYALYPHMTVEQNLSFGLKVRGVPRAQIRERVARAADLLGIADLLPRRPGTLSGGQQQRVAVGRAIVREPALFLFDEPLSNLDAGLRIEMRHELRALLRRLGTTTVYVTHDQEEAMSMADRLAVMSAGRVLQVGPPAEVHDLPADRFVASFVGTPPMNFLPGRLVIRDGRPVFESGGLVLTLPPPAATAVSPDGPDVVLGVRPSRVGIGNAPGGAAALTARVESAEVLGDWTDVAVRLPSGEALRVRHPGRLHLREGEAVALTVQPADVHLFAPGLTGRRLWSGSPAADRA